jgi:hypothetical protein
VASALIGPLLPRTDHDAGADVYAPGLDVESCGVVMIGIFGQEVKLGCTFVAANSDHERRT